MTMGKTNDFQDVSPIKTIGDFPLSFFFFRGGVNSELCPIESMGLVYFLHLVDLYGKCRYINIPHMHDMDGIFV